MTRAHNWTGPNGVNRHVHCFNCGKIFEINKAKGSCPGTRCQHQWLRPDNGVIECATCGTTRYHYGDEQP